MTPNIPQCFYRVSIKALILDETKSKFLIGLSKNGKWSLLGGGLNWGETINECLSRELKEETGLEVISCNPSAAYFIPGKRSDGDWAINVIHEAVVKDLNITPSDECVETRFVSAHEAGELNSSIGLQLFARVFDSTLHKRFRRSKDPRGEF